MSPPVSWALTPGSFDFSGERDNPANVYALVIVVALGVIGFVVNRRHTSVGLALRSMLRPGYTHRTAQLNVHFLSKGEGTRIFGRGRSLHLGQRMGYGEAEVLDGEGRLLARATGTFIVLPAPGAF